MLKMFHLQLYAFMEIGSTSTDLTFHTNTLYIHTYTHTHRLTHTYPVYVRGSSCTCMCYQSMAVVVAQLSADGPVGVFFYLLLVRKHNSLIKPGELQLHTGSLLQRTGPLRYPEAQSGPITSSL